MYATQRDGPQNKLIWSSLVIEVIARLSLYPCTVSVVLPTRVLITRMKTYSSFLFYGATQAVAKWVVWMPEHVHTEYLPFLLWVQ